VCTNKRKNNKYFAPVYETSFSDGTVADENNFSQPEGLHPGRAARRPHFLAEVGLPRVKGCVVPVRHRESENLPVALRKLLQNGPSRRTHRRTKWHVRIHIVLHFQLKTN